MGYLKIMNYRTTLIIGVIKRTHHSVKAVVTLAVNEGRLRALFGRDDGYVCAIDTAQQARPSPLRISEALSNLHFFLSTFRPFDVTVKSQKYYIDC